MGFLGVLDPLASGVLPVFVGKATRLIPEFEGLDKSYRVRCRLGQTTNTLDAEGKVLVEREVEPQIFERVPQVLQSFEGEMEQEAPIFSALKIQGKPSYALARQGMAVVPKCRKVRFWDLALEGIQMPYQLTFHVSCSKGAYIRSLVRDVGEALGTGAHVCALERLAVGPYFLLENALSHSQIAQQLLTEKNAWTFLQSPLGFLPQFQVLQLNAIQIQQVKNGMCIENVYTLPQQPTAPTKKTRCAPKPNAHFPQKHASKGLGQGLALDMNGELLALGLLEPMGSAAINAALPMSHGGQILHDIPWRFTPKRVLC